MCLGGVGGNLMASYYCINYIFGRSRWLGLDREGCLGGDSKGQVVIKCLNSKTWLASRIVIMKERSVHV